MRCLPLSFYFQLIRPHISLSGMESRHFIQMLTRSWRIRFCFGAVLTGVVLLFCCSLFLSSREYSSHGTEVKSVRSTQSPPRIESPPKTVESSPAESQRSSLETSAQEIDSEPVQIPVEEKMAVPVFYRFNTSELSHLQEAQAESVSSLIREYNNFYAAWSHNPSSGTVESWNKKAREFELELMNSIGPEAMDRLTVPQSP